MKSPEPGARTNTAPLGQSINAALKIVLDGSLMTGYPDGLDIRSSGNLVRGLVIQRFFDSIYIADAADNRIQGNFVGTNAQGNTSEFSTPLHK